MKVELPHAPEYRAYERARDAVLQMKAHAAGGVAEPSAYWHEELGNIDYLSEASPLIVRKLRHHAFHITGIRPYDYRSKHDGRREHFEARLQALRAAGGDELIVAEAPQLGGFGYDIDGRLFNVDTLKFAEVLIGMQQGGVLDEVRRRERPLVCEIGAGWGGFAYQFKTLFPSATYVIVDFAELFLFSATYLGALFPGARLLFCGTTDQPGLDGWRDADFVFVPHTMAAAVSGLPIDLTVNMVSFQEMTRAQVERYAAMAADAQCPLLYSLNRERSPYNEELESVSAALATRYDLADVRVLDTDYTSAMKKPPKAGKTAGQTALGYRHLVGRLRPARAAAPPVVLGMTIYNNARHLREALDSLLAQTFGHFQLVLLDDASTDDSEAIAREYEARDPRVRYYRHDSRRAMIATWREVAEIARREYPGAPCFAWVSDHDRWHPRWLERLVAELDSDPEAVLAYPITQRMTPDGDAIDKGPRRFDTADCTTLEQRWRRFCHAGVGAGDMVYGLVRTGALAQAGIFRPVLRPDRLLMAELTLQGRIRQVPEVLWFRRQSNGTSIERQQHTLLVAGEEPRWFFAPPWLQHTVVLWNEYAAAAAPALRLSRGDWVRMLTRYQLTYGWRHFRKTEASHAVGRGISRAIWMKKLTKHHYHHAVYNTLVGARATWGRTRRAGRRVLYEALMLTHRLGLRGRGPVR